VKKYETLYERYKTRIASGTIKNGERLPSIREEAAASGLSINTVVGAYERLVDEGWARPRERSGYFARGRARLGPEAPAPFPEHFVSTARDAGERLDLIFERLTKEDSSFAVASPGTDLLPVDRLEAALGRLKRSWIEYSDPAGDAALRRRIALASEESDGAVDPRDIIITNGATEALSIVLQTILKPGDTVILEAPTYFNYFRQLAPLNVEIVEVPVGHDGMDLDILARELGARAVRAIIVQPNVQNPPGATMSDTAKARLVALAAAQDATLIQDDVYGDLFFGIHRPKNLSAFGDHPNQIFISSFSKSIAPGLRIGWIRSSGYAARFAEAKLCSSMDSCRAAQAALTNFVATKAHRRHLAALRAALEKRVDEHIEFLADILPNGCAIQRPSGGCLLWIRLPSGTDATATFEKSAGEGLIAAPGELFSSNPFFKNYLRINAGWKLTTERAQALSCLRKLL